MDEHQDIGPEFERVLEMDANLEAAREHVRSEMGDAQAATMHVYATGDVSEPDERGNRTVTNIEVESVAVHGDACESRCNAPAFAEGDKVSVMDGPWCGAIGEIIEVRAGAVNRYLVEALNQRMVHSEDQLRSLFRVDVTATVSINPPSPKLRFAVRDTVRVFESDAHKAGALDDAWTGTIVNIDKDARRYCIDFHNGWVCWRDEDQIRHADPAYAQGVWDNIERAQFAFEPEPIVLTERLLAILRDNLAYPLKQEWLDHATTIGFIIFADEEREPTDAERARYRAVREAAIRKHHAGRDLLMGKAIGLDKLLASDILHAIVFGHGHDVQPAKRVGLCSETLNSIAQVLGLRNGRVTGLVLPPRIAEAVRRADRILSDIEIVLFPNADLGRAWQDRAESKR